MPFPRGTSTIYYRIPQRDCEMTFAHGCWWVRYNKDIYLNPGRSFGQLSRWYRADYYGESPPNGFVVRYHKRARIDPRHGEAITDSILRRMTVARDFSHA